MKTNRLLNITFPLLFLLTFNGFGQECTREGNFTDGPDYPIKGKATLIGASGKNLVLKFSDDFSTKEGPDLDVYLANTAEPDENSKNINDLKSATGAQEYEIPADIKLETYKYVLIHCTEYNHFWGNAMLGEVMGDCTTTSIDDNTNISVENIKLVQLGNSVEIQVPSNFLNTFSNLSVYDITGQQVYTQDLNIEQVNNYKLDKITSGLYFISLSGNSNRLSKKVYIN